jgi:uncharacterized protein YjiS (DUF1127 family)
MWSAYRLPGHSAVTLRPAGSTDRLGAPFARDIGDVLQELKQRGPIELVKAWRSRRHYRRELGRLLRVGRHMISDIGLTLPEAQAEMNRPFWRP